MHPYWHGSVRARRSRRIHREMALQPTITQDSSLFLAQRARAQRKTIPSRIAALANDLRRAFADGRRALRARSIVQARCALEALRVMAAQLALGARFRLLHARRVFYARRAEFLRRRSVTLPSPTAVLRTSPLGR